MSLKLRSCIFRPTICLMALLIVVGLSGCGDDTKDAGSITVLFGHTAGGSSLILNDIRYTSAAGHPFGVTLLEYIVTNIRLGKDDGSTVDLQPVFYRNADFFATESFLVSNIPGGKYTSIQFRLGINGSGNQTGALPNTADYNNMAWPAQMGGGYHYMRLEGRYQSGGNELSFLAHTGPTMGNDNSFTVSLPVDVDMNGNAWEVQVLMDVNQWFTNPTAYNFNDYQGMIMSNQAAQTVLKANGSSVFSIGFVRGN